MSSTVIVNGDRVSFFPYLSIHLHWNQEPHKSWQLYVNVNLLSSHSHSFTHTAQIVLFLCSLRLFNDRFWNDKLWRYIWVIVDIGNNRWNLKYQITKCKHNKMEARNRKCINHRICHTVEWLRWMYVLHSHTEERTEQKCQKNKHWRK